MDPGIVMLLYKKKYIIGALTNFIDQKVSSTELL